MITLKHLYRFASCLLGMSIGVGLASPAHAADTSWITIAPALPEAVAATGGSNLPTDTVLHIVVVVSNSESFPGYPGFYNGNVNTQPAATYLQQNGFTNIQQAASGFLVEADGTVAAIESAFNTHLKQFTYHGRQVYGNDQPVQMPSALQTQESGYGYGSAYMQGVFGVQNVVSAHAFQAIAATPSGVSPPTTGAASLTAHEMTEFPALYDNQTLPPATSEVIAVLLPGDVSASLADLKAYTQSHGLPDIPVELVQTGHGTYQDDPANDLGWTTALEAIAGSTGGLKKLVIYNPPDLSDGNLMLSFSQVLLDQTPVFGVVLPRQAAALLLPFGEVETDANATGVLNSLDDALFQVVTTSWIVPSGDAGAYAASDGVIVDANGHWLVDPGTYSVYYPASSVYANAVGGSSLYTIGSAYSFENGWNAGLSPAAGSPGAPAGAQQLHAGGGGLSTYETLARSDDGYSGGWATTTHNQRVVPDVAYDADPLSGGQAYRQNAVAPTQVGGTLLAAALYAGLSTRMMKNYPSAGYSPISLISETPKWYEYWEKKYNFHFDRTEYLNPINMGNNGYGGYGFRAVPGYDGVGGWGSFKGLPMAQLLYIFKG